MKKRLTKEALLEFAYITLGIMIMSFAFSFFLVPMDVIIGGVSGLSIILRKWFDFDPALIVLILNMILLFFGLLFIGKNFFIKTVYGSLAFPLFIALFSMLAKLTEFYLDDYFLIVIFSSILSGIGLGLVIKYGGTTGGTEIPQKIMAKYLHIPFSASLYILDGAVIFLGFLAFQDVVKVLYAIIFVFITGFVIDLVVFSGFNKRAVYIISKQSEEIKQKLLYELNRGATNIIVSGAYTNNEQNMLVCVLSSREYFKLRTLIEHIDPNAFYYMVRASEVRGEGFTYEKK